MTFVESKADFIQGDHGDEFGDHCSVVLQLGRETGLDPMYSMGKWELMTKAQGGGSWMENDYEETSGVRGIPAAGRPR